jgi:AcrR family transcriptional regulator
MVTNTETLPRADGLTVKGRATRERILQSAVEIILADGLAALSLDKVRMHAEVSGSQLTHYFDGKQVLVLAVLERQMELIMGIHRTKGVGDLGTWADWENWVEVNVRFLRKFGYCGRPTYHGLAGQLTKFDDSTRQAVARGYWRWVEFFEDRLTRMKTRGLLIAAADPHQLALVVVAAHQGGCLLSFTYRQAWPLANTLRFIVNHLRVLATDPAERTLRQPRQPWGLRRTSTVGSHTAEPRLTRKGVATRARIVSDAAALMFERGVRNTSLDDVRNRARVSGSQLAHYFVDKTDLILQVIATNSAGMQEFLSQPEFESLATMRGLHAWKDACIATIPTDYLSGGCRFGSLVAELMDTEDVVVDKLADGYDAWLQRFRGGITTMIRGGELDDQADPRHLAISLVAAHQGGAALTHTIGSIEPCTALIGAAVNYVASFEAGILGAQPIGHQGQRTQR